MGVGEGHHAGRCAPRCPEFYLIVGRPDLAASYRHNSTLIDVTRALGYAALGLGTITLAYVMTAADYPEGLCFLPRRIDSLSSCDGPGIPVGLPLLLTGTGAALLIAASGMSQEPIPLQEKRALAREYNARQASGEAAPRRPGLTKRRPKLAVSGAAVANGGGGLMLLGGRF